MITADTITDEQIVDLRNASIRSGEFKIARDCESAISSTLAKFDPHAYREARSRVAKVLNERAKTRR